MLLHGFAVSRHVYYAQVPALAAVLISGIWYNTREAQDWRHGARVRLGQ